MFDMRQIAAKLKQLRMEKGITQMELADLMGVSYQAVSNWERGNSMPDIGKLPELAEIFSCRIDDLLGHTPEAEFIKKVDSEENVTPTPELLTETAPILKPQQVADYSKKMAQEKNIALSDITLLAPFLDQETLLNLLSSIDFREKNTAFSDLVSLAPFLRGDALGQLLEQYLAYAEEELDLNGLAELAPFLGKKMLSKLLSDADLEKQKLSCWNLQSFAPFTDREAFSKLTKEFLKQGNRISGSELISIAPFLEKQTVGECLNAVLLSGQEDTISIEEITSLAPFVEKEMLGILLGRLLGKQ